MNNSELNMLQDLFVKAPAEVQSAIFVILNYIVAKNKLPQGENLFDLQSESGIEQIKKSKFIKDTELDNFKEDEISPVVISKAPISKQEEEDIKQFEEDLQSTTIETNPNKKERNSLTDTLVIKNLKATGNAPGDCKNAKKEENSPQIESLWSKYSKLYGEEKALEIGRKILEIANADYNYGIKELKGAKAREYWKNIADQAEKKFGVKSAWGIAYKAQIILLTADKLGYPVDVIGG